MKYNYIIKRSSRRTLSMTLTADNQVIVHAPLRMSVERIEKFISDKSGWLDKHIAKNAAVNLINKQIIEYKSVLVGGVAYPLIIGDKNLITDSCVYVKSLSCLKDVYCKYLQNIFLSKFSDVCNKTNLQANSVTIKNYKSRWGCCDGKDNIIFNYKLMMLPENLQVYVMVHELCHTVHHDHSKNFWSLVSAFLPNYKSCIKQIKNYSFLNNIY